ncbi:MAG: hypothetical protein R5N75_08925 [Cutibacterium granulosum]|uniref:hypothetical protein n=1 Tax=Cutibacterium granulosum TaxID=33011 RepID=UPI002B23AC6F|nr:hypothetical protein [Cutibacterium granulosum]MEA5660214.1 hypothetical protein [Cutibacterium granulosum]
MSHDDEKESVEQVIHAMAHLAKKCHRLSLDAAMMTHPTIVNRFDDIQARDEFRTAMAHTEQDLHEIVVRMCLTSGKLHRSQRASESVEPLH